MASLGTKNKLGRFFQFQHDPSLHEVVARLYRNAAGAELKRHCFGNVITSLLRGSSLRCGPARAIPICAVAPAATSSNGLVIVPIVVNDENTKGTPLEAKGRGPSSIPKCRWGASEFPLLPNKASSWPRRTLSPLCTFRVFG